MLRQPAGADADLAFENTTVPRELHAYSSCYPLPYACYESSLLRGTGLVCAFIKSPLHHIDSGSETSDRLAPDAIVHVPQMDTPMSNR